VLQLIVAFLTGLLFALGLIVSGMSNPAKVLNFLDVTGAWDPTLALVMGGALLVAFPAFRRVLKQPKPVFEERFHLPTKRQIDSTLLSGAALFGIGWGLAGLCPGPALTAAGSGSMPALVFTVAMIVGAWAWKSLDRLRSRSRIPSRPPQF
jgi:uncharacterized membrane protein YedE/YeeE